ncbi:hypothetical protein [Pseudokordiimonas caeni]|uniref:hypothetical protein n=1 Tax=Pseudokordiimonas caeni TaxID=2997908 RepID=UPI002810F46C|nr:hypothetical protein [Pseudokordiimonas caeni]
MSEQATEEAFPTTGSASGQLFSDLNAGFAFFLDCVVNLFVLSGILLGAFGMPTEVVFGKIIPGAIVGIVAGNALFIWQAKRTSKATGNPALTSIPLGIDLPTIFGMCFFIVGPAYVANVDAMGSLPAAEHAWQIGMAAAFWMAIIKFILSFFGRAMQTQMPQMALVGAMAGIATVWLGAEALLGVFALPEVSLVSMMIMAFALIAGHRLPFSMPGAVIAIVVGTLLYYVLAFAGAGNGYVVREAPELIPAIPTFTIAGITAMSGEITNSLGIVFPFALLIAASAVNIVAGARIVGDHFDPRQVVQIDATATFISAIFGGIVQTTPYFGHTTYKRMGARTGYAIGAVSLIAIGGLGGVIAFASQMIPEGVLKPILVVVASDILRLAFAGGDARHAPALLFAMVPGILNYAFSKVSDLYGRIGEAVQQSLGTDWQNSYLLLGAMSRGYILTSLIWGAMLVWIIDRSMKRAAFAAIAAAVFTLFGVIHSVLPSSGMYLPWAMPAMDGFASVLPYRLAAGYLITAIMLFLFSLDREKPKA